MFHVSDVKLFYCFHGQEKRFVQSPSHDEFKIIIFINYPNCWFGVNAFPFGGSGVQFLIPFDFKSRKFFVLFFDKVYLRPIIGSPEIWWNKITLNSVNILTKLREIPLSGLSLDVPPNCYLHIHDMQELDIQFPE